MAALPPEFRALPQSVMDYFKRRLAVSESRCAMSERRIAVLEGELRAVRKTAQNSSLPPSAEHPHAKTFGGRSGRDGRGSCCGGRCCRRAEAAEKEAWRAAGASEARADLVAP